MNSDTSRNTHEDLRDLLATRWRPIGLASNKRGCPCPIDSTEAAFFSVGGAVQYIYGMATAPATMHALTETSGAINGLTVLVWESQPGRTIEDILWLLETAYRVREDGLHRRLAISAGNLGAYNKAANQAKAFGRMCRTSTQAVAA